MEMTTWLTSPWPVRARHDVSSTVLIDRLILLSGCHTGCHLCLPVLLFGCLAGIVVVSGSEANPEAELERLSRNRALSASFQNGSYDTNLYRLYVLLHDNHAGPQQLDRAVAVFRKMKESYQAGSCRLLRLNSLPPPPLPHMAPPEPAPHDMWRPYLRSVYLPDGEPPAAAAVGVQGDGAAAPAQPAAPAAPAPAALARGQFLSADDLAAVQSLVADLVMKGVLPHIEKKMRFLHGQVATQRKGFGNRLKAMFGRKTKEGGRYVFAAVLLQLSMNRPLLYLVLAL
jgi:hypothetical protein